MSRARPTSLAPFRLRPIVLLAAAGLAACVPARAQQPPPAAPGALAAQGSASLPIERITLYRSGVASIERRGSVQGDAVASLKFRSEQINDILKSLVVLDLDGGSVDAVGYESKEPLQRRLAGFGIDLSDDPAAGEILRRLRGVKVRIRTSEGDRTGTVLNVEQRPTVFPGSQGGDTGVFQLPWINLVTETGVESINLTNAVGFEVLDPALAADLTKALAAISEQRSERTRNVDLRLRGKGARQVLVSYVQEAPVWKTSYRLVLPEESEGARDDAKRPLLQGWAIVENVTDDDWTEVELSLVSGRPVSFQMDLYAPLFTQRPTLPVPFASGAAAIAYAEGYDDKRAEQGEVLGAEDQSPTEGVRMSRARSAPARGAPELNLKQALQFQGRGMAGKSPFTEADSMLEDSARAAGVETGEVFQFRVEQPVTIERQRSAMIPILGERVDARRVSIFRYGDDEHPMRGLELTNTTQLNLMPGPVAVYDAGTYAGDAQVGDIAKGQRRLLSYSVDQEVGRTRTDESAETVQRVRIVKGAFEMQVQSRQSAKYTLRNEDKERPRTLIVEHPRLIGWDLVEPAKVHETTADAYRFEVPLAPDAKADFAVVQRRTESRTVGLLSLDTPTLAIYRTQGQVSPKVMEAFETAGKMKHHVADLRTRASTIENQLREIDAEQVRIRENMKTIDRGGDLYTRLLKKLGDQETRIEELRATLATTRQEADQAQKAFDDYVANLNVE